MDEVHWICFDEYVDGSVGWECLCGFITVYPDKIKEHAAQHGIKALGAYD